MSDLDARGEPRGGELGAVAALQRNAQESIPANRAAAASGHETRARSGQAAAEIARLCAEVAALRADLPMAREREGATGLEYRGG